MKKKDGSRKVVAFIAIVFVLAAAAVGHAETPLPPVAVRVGSVPYYSLVEEWLNPPPHRPELDPAVAYYSRYFSFEYTPDHRYDIAAFWVVGNIDVSKAEFFIECRSKDRTSFMIEYFTLNSDGTPTRCYFPVNSVDWDIHIGLVIGPGAPPESWAYLWRVEHQDGAFTYFEVPNWQGGTYDTINWDGSQTQVPVPNPPSLPPRPDPGVPPTITYPSLTDPGSTPAPGPLPGIGDITPLPGIPLDDVPPPPPDPDPADPVPIQTDPVVTPDPVQSPDPVVDPDPALIPDPVPSPDPASDPDPIPIPDPVPAADPVPIVDPLPEPDPLPEADPIPVADPLPEADPVLEPDPLPPVDEPLTPDPLPGER